MLVDDNPELLQALKRQLRSNLGGRARILALNQSDRALDRLHKLPPEQLARTVVVLDYRMPEMSGDEFVWALGKLNSAVPVVFLSGHIPPDAQNAMQREPAVKAILPKPWDEAELASVLLDLIGK